MKSIPSAYWNKDQVNAGEIRLNYFRFLDGLDSKKKDATLILYARNHKKASEDVFFEFEGENRTGCCYWEIVIDRCHHYLYLYMKPE